MNRPRTAVVLIVGILIGLALGWLPWFRPMQKIEVRNVTLEVAIRDVQEAAALLNSRWIVAEGRLDLCRNGL